MESGRPPALKRRNGVDSREAEKKRLRRVQRLEEEALDARDNIILAEAAVRAERARVEAQAKVTVEPCNEELHLTPPPSPETCLRNGIPAPQATMPHSLPPVFSFEDFADFELGSEEEEERLLNLAEDDSLVPYRLHHTPGRDTGDNAAITASSVRADAAKPASAAVARVVGPATRTDAAKPTTKAVDHTSGHGRESRADANTAAVARAVEPESRAVGTESRAVGTESRADTAVVAGTSGCASPADAAKSAAATVARVAALEARSPTTAVEFATAVPRAAGSFVSPTIVTNATISTTPTTHNGTPASGNVSPPAAAPVSSDVQADTAPPYDSPEARLARRTEWATRHSSKWTPKSKTWKRLRQDSGGCNNLLPKGDFFVDRVLDVDTTNPNNPRYRVLWADAPKEEKTGWVTGSAFTHIEIFASNIRLILRMKASHLSRAEFLKTDPVAQEWKTRRRSQGDDGENGWCAFIDVGVALEQLGANNPVAAERIKAFTAVSAIRRGVGGFPGVWWRALKTFILGLRRYGVNVDHAELKNPRRKKGEHGIKEIERMNLEPGINLLGAYKKVEHGENDLGHKVVLEVTEDKVTVYDEDEIGDIDDIMWVHGISFVYRIKLAEQKWRGENNNDTMR